VVRLGAALLLLLGASTLSPGAAGEPEPLVVDRVVVRFTAPELGGASRPRYVHERELSFEARLVALADPAFEESREAFRRQHLQAALERHVAEELLAALQIDPEPSAAELALQRREARAMAEEQAGGAGRLLAAASAEGIDAAELERLFERRSRASLYLHRMVAPMLEPSTLELRRAHQLEQSPFSGQPFDEVRRPLERWYVARSLRRAAAAFFQNARARLRIELY
jgi:hypothetical protein